MSADTTAQPTRAEVLAALVELGDTADQVADRMRALGIKGPQVSACYCPIARFIRRRFGLVAFVDTRRITVMGMEAMTTWPPVAQFIANFDRGVYLDLVEGSRTAHMLVGVQGDLVAGVGNA